MDPTFQPRSRLGRAFRFALERWIQRGIMAQLLLMASLIALVAVSGGLLAWLTTPQFTGPASAIWWAFLRLTDPGYLGDDQGTTLRTISTVITVLGYVLFMGSLIAIMTQWLMATVREFESGVTPISMQGHVVILGWTNRSAEILRKFLSARGRLRRFLDRRSTRRLRVVVLAESIDAKLRMELDEVLRAQGHRGGVDVLIRTGSSLRIQHLQRLDITRAAAVLIPGADFELGGSEMTDARVVKTLLGLRTLLDASPHASTQVVAELADPLKLPVAQSCMAQNLDLFAGNRVISRLVSQVVAHRSLARVLIELFSHARGNSLYTRHVPGLADHALAELGAHFSRAIPIGFLRGRGGDRTLFMDPRDPTPLRADDQVIFLADIYEDCEVDRDPGSDQAAPEPAIEHHLLQVPEHRRILILGWSRKIPTIISELAQNSISRIELTIVSRTPQSEREPRLRHCNVDAGHLDIRHVVADYAIEADLLAVEPHAFDHIVLLASDWHGNSEAADARTILCHTLLMSIQARTTQLPEILVELLTPENAELFPESPQLELLLSPRVQGHLLAHITLRPELNAVYDELFGVGGSEIDLFPPALFELENVPTTFLEIQRRLLACGLIALGVRAGSEPNRGIHLNPERNRAWTLSDRDRVVVVSRASARRSLNQDGAAPTP